jgi:hypothetical protein
LEGADVAQMNWRELRQYARFAASHLEKQLAQLDNTAVWTTALRPGTIRDLLAEDMDLPPDQTTVEHLRAIVESYDAVADHTDLRRINQLSGFQAVRQALGEFVSDPRDRQQRMLAVQWRTLHRDLGRFGTGATWQRYLSLPRAVTAIDSKSSSPNFAPGTLELDVRQLESTLRRYEHVKSTDRYRAIAGLASFQKTHQLLSSYIDLLKDPASARDGSPLPEELPPPKLEGEREISP